MKRYEDGDKNINDQIRRSVDKVRQRFKWQHGSDSKLGLDYLIHCPDHRVVKVSVAAVRLDILVNRANDTFAGPLRPKCEEGDAATDRLAEQGGDGDAADVA